MDFQRTLLIGAIALLSFMLLTEWVAFKEARTVTPVVESRLTDSSSPSAHATALPDIDAEIPAADEIPVAPEAEAAASSMPSEQQSDSSQIIQVFSDSLQLAIDLRGGDIVEVALPRHLAKLSDPNTPFVLLEQNERRTYIAQSGLIGPNGIDSAGRAQFTSASTRYEMADGQDQLQVDLSYSDGQGVDIIKRFTLSRGEYLVEVEYLISNNSQSRWQANLFGQIKRDSSAAPATDNAGMGLQPFLGAALTQPDERFTKFSFDDMAEEPFKAQLPGGWIAMIQALRK